MRPAMTSLFVGRLFVVIFRFPAGGTLARRAKGGFSRGIPENGAGSGFIGNNVVI